MPGGTKNRRRLIAGVSIVATVTLLFLLYLQRTGDDSPGILLAASPAIHSVNLTSGQWKDTLVNPFNSTNHSSVSQAQFTSIPGTTLVLCSIFNDITFNIATYLQANSHKVIVVEDNIETTFHLTKQRQSVVERLKQNHTTHSTADHSKIDDIVKEYQELATILYVLPTSLKNEVANKDIGVENVRVLVEHFVAILNHCSSQLNKVKIVLLSTMGDSPIQEAFIQLFTMILQSYQSTLGVTVVRVEEGFSRETCRNFEDLINFIYSTTTTTTSSQFQWNIFECERTKLPILNDVSLTKKTNVLFTTYFTHNKQFVRPYRENCFQFLKGFVVTAKKYNARIVMYYDRMDSLFKDRLLEFYSNIEFIQYTGNFHHRTINDARFYIMYEYLKEHPEIERIILQDLRDGIYLNDPFKVMELAGDHLYVGKDVSFHTGFTQARYYKMCEAKMRKLYGNDRYHPMLNAGTLGGTRHMILAFLKKIIEAFDDIFPRRHNCNMDAFDFVAHQFFKDVMFSGYPFQGFMQLGLASPTGIAIRHKRTKYDM